MIRFGTIRIDRVNFSISNGERTYKFIPKNGRSVRFTIASHLLLGAGHTKEELFNLAYANDIEGGPMGGRNHIEVILSHLAGNMFKHLNIELRSWRIASCNRYKAVANATPQAVKQFAGNYTRRRHMYAEGLPLNNGPIR